MSPAHTVVCWAVVVIGTPLVYFNSHVDRMGEISLLAVYWADTSVRPYGWVLSFRVIVGADRRVCPLLYAGEFLFFYYVFCGMNATFLYLRQWNKNNQRIYD